jgi:hypothetical protein
LAARIPEAMFSKCTLSVQWAQITRRLAVSFIRMGWLAVLSATAHAAWPGSAVVAQPMKTEAVREYLVWRGGASFNDLSSAHISGAIVDGGLPGTKEVWMTRRGLYWDCEDVDSIRTSVAVSEHGGWRTNLSGQAIILSNNESTTKLRESALLFAGIFVGEMHAIVSARPDETYDKTLWHIFRVSFGDEDTFDFFIRPSSGELGAIRMTEDRRSRLVVYSDWRMVQGVQQPFSQELKSVNEGSQTDLHVSRVVLNVAFPVGLLNRPKDLVQQTFSSLSNSSGWIDFKFVDSKRIFIPAKVNGRESTLLLDSGAETTVLGHGLADDAGIHCSGRIGMQGAGGSDAAALCKSVSIQLGNATITGIVATELDLDAVGRVVGVPIAAILGQEVFNAFVVDIDFENRRIAFVAQGSFKMPDGARRVGLKPVMGNRVLDISVEGKPPIPVFFDLGNGSPLDLFPSYWKPEHLLTDRAHRDSQTGGAGGKQPIIIATLRTVSLSDFTFRNVPTNFTVEAATTENSYRVKGNLGMQILSRFRLVTDYAADELYLLPDPKVFSQPFQSSTQ